MIQRRRAERLAGEILAKFGAKPPKVDPWKIAEALGVQVVGIEDKHESGSGLVVRENGRIIIGVNLAQSEVRRRFTVAHEIGHMLLHAGDPLIIDRGFAIIGHRRDSGAGDPREIEANAFAAALLMPEKWVLEAVKHANFDLSDDAELVDLARRFGISQAAMTYRLKNLGLVKNL